jgi:NAD+ synthase (glutamine-hydrolysing)
MNSMNFLRVGAAVPEIKIGNPDFNTEKICELWDEIEKKQVDIVVFPELTISGYSCGELFNQDILYQNSLKGLEKIISHSKNKNSIIIVGTYLNIENKLYNCAFLIYKGNILAGIPKTYLPSKQEF